MPEVWNGVVWIYVPMAEYLAGHNPPPMPPPWPPPQKILIQEGTGREYIYSEALAARGDMRLKRFPGDTVGEVIHRPEEKKTRQKPKKAKPKNKGDGDSHWRGIMRDFKMVAPVKRRLKKHTPSAPPKKNTHSEGVVVHTRKEEEHNPYYHEIMLDNFRAREAEKQWNKPLKSTRSRSKAKGLGPSPLEAGAYYVRLDDGDGFDPCDAYGEPHDYRTGRRVPPKRPSNKGCLPKLKGNHWDDKNRNIMGQPGRPISGSQLQHTEIARMGYELRHIGRVDMGYLESDEGEYDEI